jgi:hypothetical protein
MANEALDDGHFVHVQVIQVREEKRKLTNICFNQYLIILCSPTGDGFLQ